MPTLSFRSQPSSKPSSSSAQQDSSPSDDLWNLRPYDVPWGDCYFDYQPGMLPGHDGMCLILRSPTPIEQRRTAVACKHCRQRKAKVCVGTFISAIAIVS